MGLPLLAVLTFADSLVRGPATALLHAPLVALVELWVLDRAVEQLPDPFPLSQDLERLGGDTGEGVLGLAFGLTLFGFAEAWAVRGPLTALAAAAALAAGLVFQRRARRRRTGP
jgi:hypothetical protein